MGNITESMTMQWKELYIFVAFLPFFRNCKRTKRGVGLNKLWICTVTYVSINKELIKGCVMKTI